MTVGSGGVGVTGTTMVGVDRNGFCGMAGRLSQPLDSTAISSSVREIERRSIPRVPTLRDLCFAPRPADESTAVGAPLRLYRRAVRVVGSPRPRTRCRLEQRHLF